MGIGHYRGAGEEAVPTGDTDGVLGALIDASHFVSPDGLPGLVAHHARKLGVRETVVYLTSIDQRSLRPLSGDGVPPRESLDVEATVAGRAFREIDVFEVAREGLRHVWVPLLDGTARVGIIEFVTDETDSSSVATFEQFAGLVAELVVSRDSYGDAFDLARRNGPVTFAAELQWSILPPLAFHDGRTTVSAILEPAHDIAGDSFDYAYNGDVVDIAIIDAVGHGTDAAIVAAAGIAAYRHARRSGLDLPGIYTHMDSVVDRHFGPEHFLTAHLSRLDASTGRIESLNCGHPSPLHVRDSTVLGRLAGEPSLPVGLGGSPRDVAEIQLEPDDVLFMFSDGVVEARDPDGRFFGERRLADLLVRAISAGLPPLETPRRLVQAILDHQQDRLQDDATAILVQWHGAGPSPRTSG